MIIAGTGHRPDKLGGYSPTVEDKLIAFATAMLERYKPTEVISGMALGWDQALAMAALNLGIPYTAAKPFDGQQDAWPQLSRVKYLYLIDKAQVVVTVCPGGYAAWKMQARNEWMVRRCDTVLALWDGSSGGTANCVKYAEKRKDRTILNVWPDWVKFPL